MRCHAVCPSPKEIYVDSPELRSACSGLEDHLSRELRRSSTRYGVERMWSARLPRAALRLHGAINISPLRGREIGV